jgi:hypothetical protein
MKNQTTTTDKSLNAFLITAKINGETWQTKSAVIRAENETDALTTFKKVVKTDPRHLYDITPYTVFSSETVLKAESYPYGRLRTTAFFSVEHNGNKGMRTVFQTICPKKGRVNKPKKSTYCSVILPAQKKTDTYDNFIDYVGYLDFNGTESINIGLQFMYDFYDLFTIEQIKQIANHVVMMSAVNIKAMVIYSGSEFEDLKPLIENQIKTLTKISNTGENLFNECFFDLQAIEATKKPDFNPFRKI